MKLVCPSCAATHSAEAWQSDAITRSAFAVVLGLPAPILRDLLPYMALFRPGKNSLSWRRVKTLSMDLDKMVATQSIQMGRNAPRPCPPRVWAEGMRMVIDRGSAGQLTTPLKNHNYLRTIVYELADREDAKAENRREAKRQAVTKRAQEEPIETGREIPPEAKQALKKMGIGLS